MANLSDEAAKRLLALTVRELLAAVSILNHEQYPEDEYGISHIAEKASLVLEMLDI